MAHCDTASPNRLRPFQSRGVFAWIVLVCVCGAVPAAAAPFDDLLNSLRASADVNDYAGILSAEERANLEQRCARLRDRTGNQLTVVVLRSLQGGEINDFAEKLFQRWGVGQAGQNNGIMLLVALDDRKARIEVGYGLEGVLPDSIAGRILREQLFPRFREQQYFRGLADAVDRIARIVSREEATPVADVPPDRPAPGGDAASGVTFVFLFMIATSTFAGGAALRNGQIAGALLCMPMPIILLVLSRFLGIAWMVTGLLFFAGLIAGVLGFLLGSTKPRGRSGRGSDWGSGWDSGWGGGSWSSGGFGGGSWSSGGGGSWGGFGGGHSGGGGASGSW